MTDPAPTPPSAEDPRLFDSMPDALARLLPRDCAHLAVGVSGGVDSMVLARTAGRLADERGAGFALTLLHVHHGLRGGAADADAAFVEGLGAALGAPTRVLRADAADERRATGASPEEAARNVRYGALLAACRAIGASALALGHHADDQVETVLLNILRGTGPLGLAGMPPRRERDGVAILRPLLALSRSDVQRTARAAGWTWREDATNRDPAFRRNALRRRILPAMEADDPDLRARVLRLASVAARLCGWMTPRARAAFEATRVRNRRRAGDLALDGAALRALPHALRGEVWREAFRHVADPGAAGPPPPPRRHVERLDAFLAAERSGKRIELPGGIEAAWEYGVVVLRRVGSGQAHAAAPDGSAAAVPLPLGTAVRLGPWTVLAEEATGDAARARPGGAEAAEHLDAAGLRLPLAVRRPRAGDRYRPLGAPGTKLVSDLFTDAKVPRPDRSHALVVEDADGIVCVRPGRPAERARITARTERAIRLRIATARDGGG